MRCGSAPMARPMNWHEPDAARHRAGACGGGGTPRPVVQSRCRKLSRRNCRSRDGHRWPRLFCSADGAGPSARLRGALCRGTRCTQTGISDDTLRQLAAEAGIERDWWEVDGTHHDVTPETLRASARGTAACRMHTPTMSKHRAARLREAPMPLDRAMRATTGRSRQRHRHRRRFTVAR